MPRLAIQDMKASIWGTTSITVPSSASTLLIGDASNTSYSWGIKFLATPKTTPLPCVMFGKTSTKYPLQFRIESTGKLRAAMYDGSANPVATGGSSVLDNRWHSAVGIRSGNSVSLYIDGVFIQTTTLAVGNMSEVSNIIIGGNGFFGNIKNSFVTLSTMTAEDIKRYHFSDAYLPSNVLLLPLNEGAGLVAYDSSGNANNGTITGTWVRDTPTRKRTPVNGNLVYNGDFEYAPPFTAATTTQFRWINGTAAGGNDPYNIFGWGIDSIVGTASAQYDSATKQSGSSSLKLSVASGGTITCRQKANASHTALIPVRPSTSYTMTGWIKTNITSGTASTGVQIIAANQNSTFTYGTNNVLNSTVTTTQDWTYYTTTFTTASNTVWINMTARILNDGAATLIGDAWFDDITLTPTTNTVRAIATGRTVAGTRVAA